MLGISWWDGLVVIFWLFVLGGVGERYAKKQVLTAADRLHLRLSWSLRLLGGMAFACYHVFWQGRGDSVDYYFCSQDLLEKMLQDPLSGLKLFFLPAGDAAFPYHIYYTQGPPLAMIKLSLPFYLLGAGSYWGMSLLMGSLSWLGSWALYRELLRHRKPLRWLPAFALLYLPSVLFWAGGYSKDSLIWGALCLLLWAWLRWREKPSWLLAGGMLAAAAVIGFLKPPLWKIMLPALLAGGWLEGLVRLSWKKSYLLVSLGILVGLLYLGQGFVEDLLTYQAWHSRQAGEAASAYSLPDLGESVWGFLLRSPLLAAMAFLRPFPWEGGGLGMLAGLEGLLVLGLGGYLAVKQKAIPSLLGNPFAFSLFVFTLLLGLAAVLFSQNLGTLLRYRMPAVSFLLVSLWYASNRKLE
jgi:hypothetical protein